MLRIDDVTSDWVFAYGSLIWSPGIEYAERRVAKLYGYHRAFCITSTRYRGTEARPGAVLGLDRGGSCTGVAYRLKSSSRQHALEELFKREIPDPTRAVYRASLVHLTLGEPCTPGAPCSGQGAELLNDVPNDVASAPGKAGINGPRVQALTFLADRSLPSYIHLDIDQLVDRLSCCDGERGRNLDYAINTWNSLREMGFEDRRLNKVVERLMEMMPA